MQSFSPTTIMDGRVLCPSLPDLLRKTILTFCEGSVKFQRTLEVIGSIHICSDSEKIATFLLDEQVTRPSVGEDGHASDSASKVTANETFSSHDNNHQTRLDNKKSGSPNGEFMLPPKKSRKTLKPVRKINYRYIQNLESSDAESDNEYITIDSNGRDSQGLQPGRDYIATRPLGMLEKRMREYLDNTDSNASVSSEETYKQTNVITKQESEAQTSPSGPVSYEVSSTRPDDAVSVDQGTNESPSLSPQESTPPKEESPKIQSPEVAAEQTNQTAEVKQEMDTDSNYRYDNAFARSYESALILSTLATANNNRPLFGMMDPKGFSTEQAYAMFNNNNNLPEQAQKALASNMFTSQQEQMFAEDLRSRHYSSPEPAQNFANRTPTGNPKESAEGSWDKPVLCKICGRALKSEKMLDIHMNTAHTHKTIYPCKQCGKVFYAASSLHSHKKRTHTSMEQKYKCPHCDRFYAFQSELLRHIDTAHMELVSMSASQVGMGSDVAAFWAAYRDNPLTAPEAVQQQQQQSQQQTPQQQQQQGSPQSVSHTPPIAPVQPPPPQPVPTEPQANNRQQSPPTIQQQQQSQNNSLATPAHGATSPFTPISLPEENNSKNLTTQPPLPPPPPSAEEVKADVGGQNNNLPDDGKEQERITVSSAMGLRYKCNICSMLLKSKECLSLHINAKHTQKQAYPCNVCGKVFYAPSSRFCHIRRVHASTEQKFHCDYCDKIFTFHYELRNHLKLMHRNKMIQRSDGSVSENEPSNDAPEENSDVQDLSNGTTSPSSIANSSDQG